MNHRPSHRATTSLILLTLLVAATASASPTLEITPTRIEAGDIVLMTYAGFDPGGYEGTINIDGVAVETIDILPGGSLAFFWITPSDLTAGGHDFDICAACDQGDLEERTNTVRVIVESGSLEGSDFNLQPWAIEVTQGVRGDFSTRTPPFDELFFPSEDIVHVANRRTVVRVYPWVEGGPDFTAAYSVKAYLWVTVDGSAYGPLEAESPYLFQIRADATLAELRSDLRRTWNFVLPPEATRLGISDEGGSFTLAVEINPDGLGRVPECDTCFDDNTADLFGNQFRHVGRQNSFALKFRPHLMEAEVEQDDGSIDLVQRPTLVQLSNTLSSLYDVLPIADGSRGVRLMPWRNVDWEGHRDDWNDGQDAWLIENFLPGGELYSSPLNDYYAFLYWGGGPNCAGHAKLFTPFLRTSACGGPPYVAAHELNHAIGTSHAGNGHGEAEGGGFDPLYPGWHGQVEPGTWGMDIYDLRLHPPTTGIIGDESRHDYMSYGGNEWVSRYNWDLSAFNLGTPEINPREPALPPILAAANKAEDLDYVAFRGLVNESGQVDLAPFFASYVPEPGSGDGYYQIEFYDPNNGLLSSHAPRTDPFMDIEQDWTLFAEAITLPVGWSEMRLREGNNVIQTWQRSANPPSVVLTSPAPGFQWPNQGMVTLTWSGDDADNDPLYYRIFAMHGAEFELFTLASGLTSESFDLDLADLPGGGDWTIIIEATDGFDRVYSQFNAGFVDPTPPQVLILQPADGSVHVAGSTVPAMGLMADLQGEIPDANLAWYLDDNYLGEGSTIDLTDVVVGQHELKFVVYNIYQVEGSAVVNFEVIGGLAAPDLVSPSDGATAVPLPVSLDWTESPGAISYRVQVSRDPNFSNVVVEVGNLSATNIEFDPDEAGQTFFWRALAEHGTAPSDWSLSRSFTTADEATPVEDLPSRLALDLSVFPNPFNPNTTVAFELPRAGHVTVAVYDLAGRRVRSLVSGSRVAGHHTVTWDGRDDRGVGVGSGVYLVRLETPSGAMSKRALLLK